MQLCNGRALLVFTVLVYAAGCLRPTIASADVMKTEQTAPGPPVPGDWVIQQISSDPDTLNPITSVDETGSVIQGNIFEGLLTIDNFTLKLKPQLAESYEISPDQLTYLFHLCHDAKWQDGAPLTAEDVKYTYDRVQDPAVDAAALRTYLSTITSCEVLDPYTVRFVASERYFKTLESIGTLPIVPRHVFAKGGTDFNKNPFGRNPVGSGPYKFVRWETGAQVVLERDDHYWGIAGASGPAHYPKRLVFQVISEPYVAAQLLKKGEVDVVNGIEPLQWERELAHSRSVERLQKIVYDYPAYSYLGFNLRKPLFSDVRVRHAIDLLIPRDEILAQIFLHQYAGKTSGYDLPAAPSYNHQILPTPYDPGLARQLLTDAGWHDDQGDGILHKDNAPLAFTLLYRSGSTNQEKESELIQESLRRAGIDLKLSRIPFVQMIEKVQDWNFDAGMMGWSLGINGDPSQLWSGSQATIKKSSNFIGYANPAADRLIEEGRLEYDDAKRNALYQQLQKIIYDDHPVCFLFNPKSILLISNRFQNVKMFAPRPCFDLSTWWVPRDRQKYGE